jgi:lambda family phage minor tail protein L
MSIAGYIQGGSLGAEIILYEIDLSDFGQGIIRITASADSQSAISFGGQTYAPLPIEAEGFEMTADGPLPRPKLTVANLDGAFTALVEQNDDLQGAIVRRISTYDRFLDSGDDPDGDAHKPIDVYQISRKTGDDGRIISWELSALMDQEGVELPARKIVRDYCDHEYRRWTGAGFDYSDATCPYVGANGSFDENDDPCPNAQDRCSKRLSGCLARFGTNAPLPTRAFPGVARLRVR